MTTSAIFLNHKSMENSISINEVNLQKVYSLRFLGVYIDHQITWKDHIAYISNKLSEGIAIVHRASHYLETKSLYCLINATFKPHHNYCTNVWGNNNRNNINPVFTLLKKIYELSVMLGHWTIVLKCFVNLTF